MTDFISTHVTQYLESLSVEFRVLPHSRPATTIEDAAQQRGIRTAQMVKSIVLRDMNNRFAIACGPGNMSIDPKKVRDLLGWRRMTCVSPQEVVSITGYEIGTVVPLMLSDSITVVFDSQILSENEVTISSGSKMAGLALSSKTLIELCKPTIGDICRDNSSME